MEGFLHYLFTRPGLDYPFGHTAARFPFFILANAAMFAVSRRIAERLVPNEDSGARTIATLQIFVSHIILQLLILQLLPLPARFSDSFFYSLIISAAEYAAIAFLLPKKQGGGAPAEATPAARIAWIPAAVLFIVISAGVLWALITPPPFSDAFLDHLAYPAHWLQDETIRRVPNYFHDRSTPYYPGNAWLLYLWVLAPFSSDALTNFTHFASLLFICFIVHTTVARSGGNRFSANAAAAACLCFPFIFIFALGSEIDMFFTLFFALAAYWAWRARTGPHSAPALFLGWCALALMCGTKHLGIAYSIPLIPFLIPNIKLFSETHQTEKFITVLGKRCGEQPFFKRVFSA